MENYSHPDIPDILGKEGNSDCVDCGESNPEWASINNGVFLCTKCAEIHKTYGMSVSLVRSLKTEEWSDNQLLYLLKGGNNNYKNNLQEFNIDISSATPELRYKSKAAAYYRRYLKNEVDRISNPNYISTQVIKPDMNVAQEIIEVKEDEKKEEKQEDKKDETPNNLKNEEKIGIKFIGYMNTIYTKVKEGTTEAAQNFGKKFNELKLGEKFKTAGNAIADAARTSGQFIADTTNKAINSEFVQKISTKAKEEYSVIVQKTKLMLNKNNEEVANNPEGSEKKEESNEEKKEEIKTEEGQETNNAPEQQAQSVPEQNTENTP